MKYSEIEHFNGNKIIKVHFENGKPVGTLEKPEEMLVWRFVPTTDRGTCYPKEILEDLLGKIKELNLLHSGPVKIEKGSDIYWRGDKKTESKEASSSESVSRDLLYCDDCKALHPKEYEQGHDKKGHFCDAYNMYVKHCSHHPRIPRPSYCIYYIKENA